jgi:hypothetical protein
MVAAISKIVKNGILFDLKNWKKGMSNTDQFVQFIENVFDTLTDRNIDYLLVSGVALLSYVEGRNTQNINLILAKSDLKALPEITIIEENNDFIRGEFGNLTIDILLTQNRLFNKIILPVNNSLIDYPVKRYDRAFDLASDVINENFTARYYLLS